MTVEMWDCFLSLAEGCVRTSAQFTCSHVLCNISGCIMSPQGVCVNTPPGWRHPCFHSPRINQPSPRRALSPPLQILSTTVQSSNRLHWHFSWHGTSFTRSMIHIHVRVTRHPVCSLCLTTDHSATFLFLFFSVFSFLAMFVLLASKKVFLFFCVFFFLKKKTLFFSFFHPSPPLSLCGSCRARVSATLQVFTPE